MTTVQEPHADLEIERRITKRDLIKSWLLWTFFSHANYNYERLQATAFAHAMTPIVRRLYEDDPEATKAALRRHLVFFNTDPAVGGVIHGATIAMEEQKANGRDVSDDGINSVKTGLMGPLAGVGDTIIQGAITPLLLALGIGIAGVSASRGDQVDLSNLSGNVLGPILYLILVSAAILAIGWVTWMQGYYRGRSLVANVFRTGLMDRVIVGASVLGNLVLGGLAATFVVMYVAPTISVGASDVSIQGDILDKIMPGLLPLGLVMLTWWLLRRRIHPVWLLVAYLAFSILAAIPFFGDAPKQVGDTTTCGSSILQPSAPCPAPDGENQQPE
jgi:mannose PTS system EIID component